MENIQNQNDISTIDNTDMNNLFESYMNALNVRHLPVNLQYMSSLLKSIGRILYPKVITHYMPYNMRISRVTDVQASLSDISFTYTGSSHKWEIADEFKKLDDNILQTRSGAIICTMVGCTGLDPHVFALWCDAKHKIVYGVVSCCDFSQWTSTIQDMISTIWDPSWTMQLDSFYPANRIDYLCKFWALRYSLLRFEDNDHSSTLKIMKDTDFDGLKDMFRKFVVTD